MRVYSIRTFLNLDTISIKRNNVEIEETMSGKLLGSFFIQTPGLGQPN